MEHKRTRILPSLIACLLCCIPGAFSQTYNIRHYAKTEGLNNLFIYNIIQDSKGFLWIGTGEGFFRFDGIHFNAKYQKRHDIKLVTVSYVDRDNNLWVGHDNGLISMYDGKEFRPMNNGLSLGADIKAICDWNEQVLIVAQNGTIILVNRSDKVTTAITSLIDKITIMSVLPVDKFHVLIGTDQGLYLYELNRNVNALKEVYKFSAIPSSNISKIIKSWEKCKYWIATKDEGFYSMILRPSKPDSTVIGALAGLYNLELWNIEDLLEDTKKNLWVGSTDMGLIRFNYSKDKKDFDGCSRYQKAQGLQANTIRCVYEDAYENIWLGSFGEGMFALLDDAFEFYIPKGKIGNPQISSLSYTNNHIWAGCFNSILKLNNNLETDAVMTLPALPAGTDVTAICADEKSNFWLGTKRNGVYFFDPKNNQLTQYNFSENTLENYVNYLLYSDKILWVATNGGVIRINTTDRSKTLFSTNSGLPHNKINHLYKDSKGNIWVATKSNSLISLNSEIKHQLTGNINIEFTSIIENIDGALWASTNGYGVFKFHKDTMFVYPADQGLLSDYCYSIAADPEGNIWVGHRLGISKIFFRSGKILSFGQEVGINGDCQPNAILSSPDGLVIGTSNGLVRYNALKYARMKSAPSPEITSIRVSDKEIDETESVNLPYGKYSLRFEFVGLNYYQPNAVRYQYKLEGWDLNWSDISTTNFALYPRLDDGSYTFLVKTFSADDVESKKVLQVQVVIRSPFWKRWWFQLMVVVLILGAFYLFIQIRDKRQREFQIYLKKLLDERTAEVMEQKHELEVKNKDITDSINYARRIQSSMLPSVEKLNPYFSQSFIINMPRDIVSGDFYWFNEICGKFVMLCADSTGHGVPGAFMSLIGITLIKDIFAANNQMAPAVLLNKLDVELQNTINQNQMADKSTDGMDASLIEINMETLEVRISSAMRPVIMVHKGELITLEGSKSTIGNNPTINMKKEFIEYEYKMSRGDVIYLFTDGITDQFGGPTNKKFKVNKLKALLNEIHKKPMKEQKEIIEETFRIWKGDYGQLDDVLFIGIRL